MGWQFWRQEPGPTAVDTVRRDLIMNRFRVAAVRVDKLSVLRQAGKFVGRPVTHVRAYDPSLLNGELGEVTAYQHLDTQPQAICFEGHAEKDLSISLSAKGCMEKTTTAA